MVCFFSSWRGATLLATRATDQSPKRSEAKRSEAETRGKRILQITERAFGQIRHNVPMEKPERVAHYLAEFLAANDARR